MAVTSIRGAQILNNTVQRQDLDVSTVGQAVVTKLVQGSGITLSSTGADSGTGDVTVTSPDVVSTDTGNIATLGTDNHILVPQSQLWSVRLRTYQALSNNAFEVDQRNTGAALTNPANGTFIQDRWSIFKSAGLTGTVNTALQSVPTAPIVIPGTNFGITQNYQRFTVGTAQSSLAAGDFWGITQAIEGPRWRELALDVHSAEILVRSSIAGTFALRLRDPTTTKSLVKLCTSANTWALVQLSNLPVWVGTYSAAPGGVGYNLDIFLACGSTYLAAASNAFQNGDIRGVTGMSNFLATAGATFDIAYIGHEPGALCTTPQDCPFTQAYDDCLRFWCKSYDYGTALGTVTTDGMFVLQANAVGGTACYSNVPFPKPLARKPPTIGIYNYATGAISSVRSGSGVDHTVASVLGYNQNGFAGLNLTTAPATLPNYIFGHYYADTGW